MRKIEKIWEKIEKKYLKLNILNNMQCEYCDQWVSSEYILKTHQQTKTCMAIQIQRGVTVKSLPFECIHCHKDFSRKGNLDRHLSICKSKPTHSTCLLCKENYLIGKDEEHKIVCTYKPDIITKDVPKEKSNPKKQFLCVCCRRNLSSQQKLNNHIAKCKEKKAQELSHIKRDQKQQKLLEQNVKRIEEIVEDKIDKLESDIRTNKEEFEYELRLKEEKIKQLEQKLNQNQLTVHNGKSNQTNHIKAGTVNQAENMITNNYTTIFNYITPAVIQDTFHNYTIDQVKGGQKEYAHVVSTNLLNQNGQAGYICTDRSRKKCGYINESREFVEDVHCTKLIETSLPASLPYIMESFKCSSGDDQYVAEQPQIKKGLDDIMNMNKDRSTFVNHMCKILPSNPDDTDQHSNQTLTDTVEKAKTEIDEFEEEERQFKMQQEHDLERERKYGYQEPVARMIGGVRLGALDVFYKRYQRDGTLIIHKDLQEQYGIDETITHEYDELIKKGMFKGDIIWSV